jgi:hypothetical protein
VPATRSDDTRRIEKEDWYMTKAGVLVPAGSALLAVAWAPSAAAVPNAGLGFVQVKTGSTCVDAMEDRFSEFTGGIRSPFNGHKLFFDVARLTRTFAPYHGFGPHDQQDTRFRPIVQFKF